MSRTFSAVSEAEPELMEKRSRSMGMLRWLYLPLAGARLVPVTVTAVAVIACPDDGP